jgi:hypothetical protein
MKTKMWKMMIATIVILPMTLVSCHKEFMPGISGQGEITEQTVSLDSFDGIVTDIPADIFLTQGAVQEVVIKAQQNIIDNIELDEVNDGIWTIHYHQPIRFAKPIKIYITIPTLTKAGINGSATITATTRFTGLDQLRLFVTGSGDINLDSDSKEINSTITGSGDLTLKGTTDLVTLLVSGSGSFHGIDLVTPRAEMTVTGSGNVHLTVSDYLHAMVLGSGNVWYAGTPELDVHVTGSGSITRN